MSIESWFSLTYREARAKFLAAASAAAAEVTSHTHPMKGPDGESLAMDIARLGPHDAGKLLVTTSATHGVEGFCGSGCQIGLFKTILARDLPADTALLQIHAHNPHGFAHERRVTEDNVDLNRNFVAFSAPLPSNTGYDEIHDRLVPKDWDGPDRAAADKAIDEYVRERGMDTFQAVVTRGQYGHRDGLFFGGTEPTWSHRTIREFAASELKGCRHVAAIDFHTGLGPRGFGELLVDQDVKAPGYRRACEWYGDVKNPSAGNSVSAPVVGTVDTAYREAVGVENCTWVAIEYGTLPVKDVLQSLRADNWLYRHGEVRSALGRQIKRDIRAAFYGEDAAWKEQVWTRADEVACKALAGLARM